MVNLSTTTGLFWVTGLVLSVTWAMPQWRMRAARIEAQETHTNFVSVGTNMLATALLQGFADKDSNQAFSPLGISSLMAILAEGAEGQTRQQILTALRMPEDVSVVRDTYKDVLSRLTEKYVVNKPEFKNWFYVYKNYSVEQSFRDILTAHYLTEVRDVERIVGFHHDAAVTTPATDTLIVHEPLVVDDKIKVTLPEVVDEEVKRKPCMKKKEPETQEDAVRQQMMAEAANMEQMENEEMKVVKEDMEECEHEMEADIVKTEVMKDKIEEEIDTEKEIEKVLEDKIEKQEAVKEKLEKEMVKKEEMVEKMMEKGDEIKVTVVTMTEEEVQQDAKVKHGAFDVPTIKPTLGEEHDVTIDEMPVKPVAIEEVSEEKMPVTGEKVAMMPVMEEKMPIMPESGSKVAMMPVMEEKIAMMPATEEKMPTMPVSEEKIAMMPVIMEKIPTMPVSEEKKVIMPVMEDKMPMMSEEKMPIMPVSGEKIAMMPVKEDKMPMMSEEKMPIMPVSGEKIAMMPVKEDKMPMMSEEKMPIMPVSGEKIAMMPVKEDKMPEKLMTPVDEMPAEAEKPMKDHVMQIKPTKTTKPAEMSEPMSEDIVKPTPKPTSKPHKKKPSRRPAKPAPVVEAVDEDKKKPDVDHMLAIDRKTRSVKFDDIPTELSKELMENTAMEESQSHMLIFNALYFRGTWSTPFVRLASGGVAAFHATPTRALSASMMHAEGKFFTGKVPELDSVAIELPYEGGRYSLLVVLPNSNSGLRRLIMDLTGFRLCDIHQYLTEQQVEVDLPSFEVETTSKPSKTLNKFGISDVFNKTAADLNKIAPKGGLFVDRLSQLVTFKVDLTSSSTNFLTASSAATRGEAEKFVADRPFLFFLRDVVDHMVIVAGKVVNPTQLPPHFPFAA